MLNILIVNEHEVLQVRDSVLREGYAMAVPRIYSDGHNDDAELSTDVVAQDACAVAHQLARSFELVVIVTLGEEGCAAVLPVRPTDNDAPSGEESDAIDTIYSSALKNLKDGEKIGNHQPGVVTTVKVEGSKSGSRALSTRRGIILFDLCSCYSNRSLEVDLR